MNFSLTFGQLRVLSSVLSSLAAGWVGSIAIFPGVLKPQSLTELLVILTYSTVFATLAIYLASKIEDLIL